ncbi:MAG: Gfo/Idh/MocA family oxidoreductase, partial [Pyrinomonadaceae bacterium]
PERRALNRPLAVVVEGGGDWVEKTYRRLFKKKVDAGKELAVFYADDTRWKDERPQWADPQRWTPPDAWGDPATTGLQPWEVYLDKKNPEDFARYMNLRPDVVFVVTPDFTHSAVARHWLGKTPLVFVEKPFDSQVKNVDDLKLRYAFEETTKILGLDHYQFYALPIFAHKAKIMKHLGGIITKVEFYLTESEPIEQKRLRSLQYGLTLDMLPHLVALLTYFGDIRTIDQIEVLEAGQYDAIRRGPFGGGVAGLFQGETYSRVRFTFEDHSGSSYHIPCLAVVGKGFAREVKYLQVTGRHDNAIRVDLLDRSKVPEELRAASPHYKFDSLFFIAGEAPSPLAEEMAGPITLTVRDPYRDGPELRVLPAFAGESADEGDEYCRLLFRSRYEVLLDDLLEETAKAVASTLRVSEGQEIVRALDRIWWAIQKKKEFWKSKPLKKENPINDEAWS